MTAAQKRSFLKALGTDAAFRDQVRALLQPAPAAPRPAVGKPRLVGVRWLDEHGLHDPAGDEARRRAREQQRAREAQLPPPPSQRRRASEAIDLTGKFGSAS